MKRTILLAALAGATAFSLTACQSSQSTQPHPEALVKLGFELESPEFASLVDLVTLTVSFAQGPPLVDTLNFVQGQVVDTLVLIPDQVVTIIIEAFSAPRPPSNERILLYSGSETLTLPARPVVEVNIMLNPAEDVFMLRTGPFYQTATVGGDAVEVFVDIHNVQSLWGASFRLMYDKTILRFNPDESSEGDFLRGDPPALTIAWARDSLDYLAGTVVRAREEGVTPVGVSGSGRLMSFSFTPIGVGQTEISFVRNENTPKLHDPDLEFVTNFDELELESATVEVLAGP